MKNIRKNTIFTLFIMISALLLTLPIEGKAQTQLLDNQGFSITTEIPKSIPTVPEGKTYVEINDNIPYFTNKDITATNPWIEFSQLDQLGRVGAANAVLSVDSMPPEHYSRKDVSSIHPTGWNQGKYNQISNGGWLYNRSHLIGHQLIGDGIPELNLMTGTRWFNMEGMLPFENFVASIIEYEELLVRYRVTPIFEGGNLLASGVIMEGFSIEDNGEALQFNIFVPNRQSDVYLDYGTGKHDSKEISQTTMAALELTTHPGTTLYDSTIQSAVLTANESEANQGSNEIEITQFANNNGEVANEEKVYYENCTIAREAGADPVYAGDPGYARHLDRDGDGIGCE